MENVESRGEDQWLAKIASEYDGGLPYQNETELFYGFRKRLPRRKMMKNASNIGR